VPYNEPYSTLLTGVAARLRGTPGPFANDDQVRLWFDEALDELAPSAELQGELSRAVPIALVCDGGARSLEARGGEIDEEQTVRVWFAAHAPTMAAAVTGDGDEYWGACALKHWILTRLSPPGFAVGGWDGLLWQDTRPVAVRGTGQVLYVATFTAICQHRLTEDPPEDPT